MRLLRGAGGAVLWLLASVLALLAVVLCVTVVLLPVGLFLMGQARRLFQRATRLMLPRVLSHPVKETRKTARRKTRKGRGRLEKAVSWALS